MDRTLAARRLGRIIQTIVLSQSAFSGLLGNGTERLLPRGRGGVLLYMSYLGMCLGIGYGF